LLTAKACSDYRNIFVSIAATRHALARQDEAMDITSMTIPRYVNEDKSDMRGIKPGWYAMGGDGSSWLVLLIPVRNASVQHVKRRTANCTLSWLGPMTDDDDFLRQAQACCWSAAKAKKPEDRAFWLRLAEYWLSLVPKGGEPRTPQ
jgi:hypothetical protein